MAAYDLEEQEQLAEIKAWWKQYGNRLLSVIIIAALHIIAWQGWTLYQRNQTGQASAIYGLLQKAIQKQDTQQIKAASGELLEKFGGTTYAAMGALLSARAMMDAGDAQTAKAQILWAVEHARDELRDLASLQAAALLLDEKAYDLALAQVNGASSPAFEIRFQDTRGDILTAQGKKTEALAAYRSALNRLNELEKNAKTGQTQSSFQSNALFRELIDQKIDALGGGL